MFTPDPMCIPVCIRIVCISPLGVSVATQVTIQDSNQWQIIHPESEAAAKLIDQVATEKAIKKLFQAELFNYIQLAARKSTIEGDSIAPALVVPPAAIEGPAAQMALSAPPLLEAAPPKTRKTDDLDDSDS